MECPVCKTVDLVMADRNGIEIDYCPKCRGVWLDRGELDKIIERSAAREFGQRPPQSSAQPPVYAEKDNRYRDYDDDDYYDASDEKRKNDYHPQRPYKKKSLLGEIFDIFD